MLRKTSQIYNSFAQSKLNPVKIINNTYFRTIHGQGIEVTEKDWDNLIILDACRFDVFKERNDIEGNLTKVVSQGSDSWEFMKNNLVGKKLHDTIYVTANPYATKLSDDVFFFTKMLKDEWDKERGTVHPTDVVTSAIEMHEKYPNKKLVIHFMQPHVPWLGKTADKIRGELNVRGYEWDEPVTGIREWNAVKEGKITPEEMKKAYKETLDLTLENVKNLLDEINGKSVLTADHGEMLGERILGRARYEHPRYFYTTELCMVPWFEVTSRQRREIIQEEPIESNQLDEQIVENRLRALGYKNQ